MPGVRGPGAEGPGVTGPAVLRLKWTRVYGLALPIAIAPPPRSRPCLWGHARRPNRPAELLEIGRPRRYGLASLGPAAWAAPRDTVLVPARGEQCRADIGAIDEMLQWRHVFLAESLVDGFGALGLIDCSSGRVHLREQVGCGGLTRFADMHHVPGPLRVAFLPIARFRIIGDSMPSAAGGNSRFDLKRMPDLSG